MNARTKQLGRGERRREIRLRRSRILKNDCEGAVTYKIAQTREELEAAFGLVYDAYVGVGLQEESGTDIRFTKHHLLPTTKVFLAMLRPELLKSEPDYASVDGTAEVIGTLTLVMDGALGLPMEEVCGADIALLRSEDRNVAEVISLAIKPEYRRYNITLRLFKLMFDYVRQKGVSDICASVTQRHINFYQNILLFSPMGELLPYSNANELEVQCHRLDVAEAGKQAMEVYSPLDFDCDLYTFFFTENPEVKREKGEGGPLSEADLVYFLSERSQMIRCLSTEDLGLLRDEFRQQGAHFPY